MPRGRPVSPYTHRIQLKLDDEMYDKVSEMVVRMSIPPAIACRILIKRALDEGFDKPPPTPLAANLRSGGVGGVGGRDVAGG